MIHAWVGGGDVGNLARHGAARRELASRGEAEIARGAAIFATVATYLLATTRCATATEFADKIARLRRALADVEQGRRPHVAAMVDAALAAETSARLAAGLPPHDRRLAGWMEDTEREMGDRRSEGARLKGRLSLEAKLRYATAARADDVDLVLDHATRVVHAMIATARRGGSTDGLVDALQADALALCVWPAATPAEADGARRTVVTLWRILRRRRPLAAAILSAKLTRDRNAWKVNVGPDPL